MRYLTNGSLNLGFAVAALAWSSIGDPLYILPLVPVAAAWGMAMRKGVERYNRRLRRRGDQ